MGHAVGGKNCLLLCIACICVCVAGVVHRLLHNSGIWEWLKCKAIRDEKIYVFTVVCASGAHIFWILFKGVPFLTVRFVSRFMCSLVCLLYVGANGLIRLSYCHKKGMSNLVPGGLMSCKALTCSNKLAWEFLLIL